MPSQNAGTVGTENQRQRARASDILDQLNQLGLIVCGLVAVFLCGLVAVFICSLMTVFVCSLVADFVCGRLALTSFRTDVQPVLALLAQPLAPLSPLQL